MNKVSRVKIKNSTLVISTIAILLMVTITASPTMNASALDLGIISKDNNFGSIDTENMFNCFGAAITCDNDNTVNNNINNGTNGGGGNEPGTLIVSKEIACVSIGGSPSNQAVCEYAVTSDNYPQLSNYEFTVIGNNPAPSNFPASSTGTSVAIDRGEYEIEESLSGFDPNSLLTELSANSVFVEPTGAIGDCNFTIDGSIVASGIMNPGDSQECTIVNTLTIDGGTVPNGAPEI